MFKFFILSVALLAIGLGIGYNVGKSRQVIEPESLLEEGADTADVSQYKAKYLQLKNKLQGFAEGDFEDYVRLKNQEDQFNKANEILAKIMVVFLADLGLKLSMQAKDFAEGVISNPEQYAYKAEQKKPSGIRPEDCPTPEPVACNQKKSNRDWLQEAKKIKKLKKDDDPKELLDKVVIGDFIGELRSGTIINEQQLKKLQGWFSGEIVFDDPEEDSLTIEMSLDGYFQEGKLRGKRVVNLYNKEGEKTSSSNENGILDSIKGIKEMPSAFIVGLGRGQGYLQIFIAPRMRRWIGNYYKEEQVGEFKKVGRATLERRP